VREQGSKGAREQGSKGAREQGSKGASDCGPMAAGILDEVSAWGILDPIGVVTYCPA